MRVDVLRVEDNPAEAHLIGVVLAGVRTDEGPSPTDYFTTCRVTAIFQRRPVTGSVAIVFSAVWPSRSSRLKDSLNRLIIGSPRASTAPTYPTDFLSESEEGV